jgi:TonB family protein
MDPVIRLSVERNVIRASLILSVRYNPGVRGPILGSLVILAFVARVPPVALADGQQAPATSATPPALEIPWPPAGVLRPGPGIIPPKLTKSARPNYPPEAMRAKVQGRVKMEMVVQADGTVGEVRVVSSLDRKFGVDDAAVKAVKEMRFTPAMKDGVAVPVLLSTEMAFTPK